MVLFKGVFSSQSLVKEKLDQLEQYYIKELDTYKFGYNSTLGGGGNLGYIPSQETREKLRIACTGWKQTEETKKRISQSHIGKECSAKVLAIFKQHNDSTKRRQMYILKIICLLKLVILFQPHQKSLELIEGIFMQF